jgi:hypothetical protein
MTCDQSWRLTRWLLLDLILGGALWWVQTAPATGRTGLQAGFCGGRWDQAWIRFLRASGREQTHDHRERDDGQEALGVYAGATGSDRLPRPMEVNLLGDVFGLFGPDCSCRGSD